MQGKGEGVANSLLVRVWSVALSEIVCRQVSPGRFLPSSTHPSTGGRSAASDRCVRQRIEGVLEEHPVAVCCRAGGLTVTDAIECDACP